MAKSSRTAAITGASSGLGAQMALSFGKAGFDLVLCGRDEVRLSAVKETLRAHGIANCIILPVDVSKQAGIDAFASSLTLNEVDTVINNAAVNPELARREGLSSYSEISEVISINMSAAIEIARTAFEHLDKRGAGTIVNVNSVAGLRGSGHEPIYAASKFGLRGYSESVKNAWFDRGVRMIDVYSGAIATGMSAARPDVAQLIDPEEMAEFIVTICNARSFVPREINIQKSPPSARRRDRVVFANGVFDLLHPGHLALLKFAKSLGDKLIVGLNSDRAVRELKGPSRPIQDEQARKAVLESLRFVDQVVIFDALRTKDIVRTLMPDIIVKGDEYTADVIRRDDEVPDSVSIVTFPVVLHSDGAKLSTTAAVERTARRG